MGLFNFRKKDTAKPHFWDGKAENTADALQYLLNVVLHGKFATDDIIQDGSLYLAAWDLYITPEIQQLTDQSAVLGFYIHRPDWGQNIYECCASVGSDAQTALGMASGSFLFGFMQGISQLFTKTNPRTLETLFSNKLHRFQVYLSDIVGMGESPKDSNVDMYWELLKDDIKKRMGNQRFCYVKIYASKIKDEVIGECRINDIQSDELSQKVADFIKDWNVENFASQKQFFFLKQDTDTIQPYPYWGEQGEKDFIGKVLKAVQLFHASDTQEAFDTLHERLVAELGDPTLATECRYFLPEICAEHAGQQKQVKFSETIDLQTNHGDKITLYKHQLTDYYTLQNTIFTAFSQGIFGDETNTIYQELVGTSAICNVLEQMLEQGSNLENCQLTSLIYQIDDTFEIR